MRNTRPPSRKQARRAKRKLERNRRPAYGEDALHAFIRHLDKLQADPRPWRQHGKENK